MAVFIVGVLSLYWGALFGTVKNLPSLTAWIVDFDGQLSPYNTITPFVGPLLRRQFDTLQPTAQGNLGWTVMPPARFDYDPMNVRRGIYDEHAYLAIVVNGNATALLEAAVNNGNQSYDPTGAIQVIYNSARDQTTIYSYILPALLNTLLPITRILGKEWAVNLSRNASIQDVWNVPQAINPAVGFTLVDLRPFSPPTAIPSVSIGLIYLIIISFFNYTFLMPVHEMFMKNKHQQLYPTHLLIWRLSSNIAVYLFLSLSYSLVSLAFQIPFNNPPAADTESALNPNAFGKASFTVYWMINWVGMAALGLPSENMAMILGQPWSAFWLIFWVITNVSTGFYPLDLAPGFYKWGYAWPLNRSESSFLFSFRHVILTLRSCICFTHCNI
jgi:hypothetical protein